MSTRLIYLTGLVLVGLLLSISVYLQLYDGFIPCPLCTLQRLCFVTLGIWFLFGLFLHRNQLGRAIINSLSVLTSALGCALAGRQIWLQHFPNANANECGVSLQYMMKVLSFNELIQKIFTGSAECTQLGWEFLSLSMAEWSVVWFIFFLALTIYLLRKS